MDKLDVANGEFVQSLRSVQEVQSPEYVQAIQRLGQGDISVSELAEIIYNNDWLLEERHDQIATGLGVNLGRSSVYNAKALAKKRRENGLQKVRPNGGAAEK
jgi:hypothetical protein